MQQKLRRTGDIFFIDTLDTVGEYLIWNEGEFSVENMGMKETEKDGRNTKGEL